MRCPLGLAKVGLLDMGMVSQSKCQTRVATWFREPAGFQCSKQTGARPGGLDARARRRTFTFKNIVLRGAVGFAAPTFQLAEDWRGDIRVQRVDS